MNLTMHYNVHTFSYTFLKVPEYFKQFKKKFNIFVFKFKKHSKDN